MSTVGAWTDIWWYWLVMVAGSWAVLEGGSIARAHVAGEKNVFDWTLSDTIRRWSSAIRLVAPLTCGTAVFLLYHFFIQTN